MLSLQSFLAAFCKFTTTILGVATRGMLPSCCSLAQRDVHMDISLAICSHVRLHGCQSSNDCLLPSDLRTVQRCMPITVKRNRSKKALQKADELDACGCGEVQRWYMRLQRITCPLHSHPTWQLSKLEQPPDGLRSLLDAEEWEWGQTCILKRTYSFPYRDH